MRVGINANTTEDGKAKINRTSTTYFHKARISAEETRGTTNIAQCKDHQTNIHQTMLALSITLLLQFIAEPAQVWRRS